MRHFFAFPDELERLLLYWVRMALSLSMVGLIAELLIGKMFATRIQPTSGMSLSHEASSE